MSEAGRRRPDSPGLAHPLLVDWLDSEPGARGRVARVLVVGARADAEVFTAADHVASAAGPDLVPLGGAFDLVVAVDCLRADGIGAQLDRLSGAVDAGGQLLVIAATGSDRPDVLTAADLSPLRAAGLRLVAFDDLTEDGPDAPDPGRWIRALYRRDGHSSRR
jgi:hypothetical protein